MTSETRVSLRRPDEIAYGATEWVQVRSKDEILATLDERGRLDRMPFMPEMFQFCGQRFQVFRSAHKTCDTVNRTGGRRVEGAVHLDELRCDGSAHGGCDAGCLIFWKDAWLKPVDGPRSHTVRASGGCTEADVVAATQVPGSDAAEPVYSCQATTLPEFTEPLRWSELRQYYLDWRSGNERLRTLVAGAVYVATFGVIRRADRPWIKLRAPLIGVYDMFQRLAGGVPFPRKTGRVAPGERTPAPEPLHLQPGEMVRIKPYEEILATLDRSNKNRGMFFDAEEVPYCGGTFRVRSIVRKIVDERSGRMIELKGHPVILEDVWCKGHYSDRRMFCPRAIYSFWREAWLERA